MEELFQVVLKGCPSQQQLVVDLIPIENSEKLLRTSHYVRYETRRAPRKCKRLHLKDANC